MKLLLGDCVDKMKELPANSVDTGITDPPYGLEFMGKDWDSPWKGKAGKDFNTSCAGKLGGFKKLPNYTRGNNTKCLNCKKWKFSSNPCNCGNPQFPNTRQLAMIEFQKWFIVIAQEMLRVIKPGGTLLCFGGTRTYHRLACAVEDAGWILKDCIMWLYGSGFPKATDISKQLDKGTERENEIEEIVKEKTIFEKKQKIKQNKKGKSGKTAIWQKQGGMGNFGLTKPTTSQAKLWNGWKSHGLKPAYEPILVAMKPNEDSYAANALKWGVSGLNIDGGKINTEDNLDGGAYSKGKVTGLYELGHKRLPGQYQQPQGRFPANIILDEDAAEQLGEPSRFFYVAKASKAERNMGCKELDIRQTTGGGGMNNTPDDVCGKYGSIKVAGHNHHPTVKPLKLMQYLCTLTKTPTGGVVLDPFMGSGTTGMAAVLTGREFIGIEKEPEYMEIAKKRIEAVSKQARLF